MTLSVCDSWKWCHFIVCLLTAASCPRQIDMKRGWGGGEEVFFQAHPIQSNHKLQSDRAITSPDNKRKYKPSFLNDMGMTFLPCLLTLFHFLYVVLVTTHWVYAAVSLFIANAWPPLKCTLFIGYKNELSQNTESSKLEKKYLNKTKSCKTLWVGIPQEVGGDYLYSSVAGHISQG